VYSDSKTDATPAMARIITFIEQFTERHGYGPSAGDIGRGLRLHRSWAFRIAKQAVARGLLVADPKIARSWRLPATTRGRARKG
jgi:hypothetical protein